MEGREETRTRAERAGAERRRERSSSRRSLGERKVSALSFSTSASASPSCLSSESSSRVRTRTFFICRRVIFLKEARGREGEGGGIERGRQKNGKKNDFTPLLFPFFSLLLVSLSQVCSFFVEEREDAVVFVFLESSLAVDDAAARSSRPSTRRCRCRRLVDAAVAVTVAANFAAFLLLFPPAVAFPPRLFPPRVRHGEIISKRGLREHGRDRSLVPGREVRSLMFPGALVFFETSARSLAAGQKKKNSKRTPSRHHLNQNRFGSKAEAAALLAEWATKIAPRALAEAGKLGAGAGRRAAPSVRVLSGAVGASESRLEVEVSGLPSLAALEVLWEALPREEHRHWQERLARHVVDGSTRWEVFHELGAVVGRGGGGESEARAPTAAFSSPSPPATTAEEAPSSPSPLLVVSGDEAAAILQSDAVAAAAAIEKSGNGGASAADGGPSRASPPPAPAAGRGRPRSLERAAAAGARAAAAEASKGRPPPPSPPYSPPLPPITISSILGAAKSSNGSSSSNGGSSSDGGSSSNGGSSSDGFGGSGGDLDTLDTSKLVPGQRLPDGSVVATDWKGDVMIIRPGDRGVAGL